MPRMARAVAAGLPHHVTQRGNRGLDVFFTADDRQEYLVRLAEYAGRHGLKVWAYCLMSNHVHLVVVPSRPESLADTLRPLHMRHAQRVNAERGWQGHLWQGRYFSCPLDEPHLWEAVRYVERNPVRAGIVGRAEAYPWSSAAPHCGLRADPVLSPDLPLLGAVDDWPAWLEAPDDAVSLEQLEILRRRTHTGLPCGNQSFVKRVARLVGRPLEDRSRGRPKVRKAGGRA